MPDQITTFTFSATAATERFIKAHTANAPTYFLIIAVIALSAVKAALDFIAAHAERAPEYRLIARLHVVRAQRRAVQIAIRAEHARLQAAPKLTAAMDRILCLG